MNKNLHLKKSLGQNFLNDKDIVKKIIDITDIPEEALIVEVGPGSGMLTQELVKYNVNVVSIEIDERLKIYLDKKERLIAFYHLLQSFGFP